MLSVKELRICNFVYSIPNQKIHSVSKRTLRLLSNGKNNYLEPININEEWLLKLGLQLVESESIKNYCIHGVCIEKIDYLLIERRYGIIIKYVHQLQNLIFALTQKELELC